MPLILLLDRRVVALGLVVEGLKYGLPAVAAEMSMFRLVVRVVLGIPPLAQAIDVG